MPRSPKIQFAFREIDKGWKKLYASMDAMAKKDAFVKVGVLDEGPGGETHDPESGLSNAELAAIHEFGTRTIPERSFIRRTYDEKLDQINEFATKLAKGIFDGKLDTEKALNIFGAWFSAEIKKRVTTGEPIPPPLAPSTLRRKQGKGPSGKAGLVRTLIDTARMIGAVSWLVVLRSRR